MEMERITRECEYRGHLTRLISSTQCLLNKSVFSLCDAGILFKDFLGVLLGRFCILTIIQLVSILLFHLLLCSYVPIFSSFPILRLSA
jgi:hypothetical protein